MDNIGNQKNTLKKQILFHDNFFMNEITSIVRTSLMQFDIPSYTSSENTSCSGASDLGEKVRWSAEFPTREHHVTPGH